MNTLDHAAIHRAAENLSEAGKLIGAIHNNQADPKQLLLDRDELVAAAGEAIAMKAGACLGSNVHPSARTMALWNLYEIASLLTVANGRRNVSGMQTMSDLAPAFGAGFQRLASISYAASAAHLQIVRAIELPNYTEFTFPSSDTPIDVADLVKNEHGEWKSIRIFTASGQSGRVIAKGAVFGLSEEVMRNDAVGLYATTIGGLGGFASRRQSKDVISVLNDNSTLADGRQIFNATDQNLMTTSALTSQNLGISFSKMRRQKTVAGNESNNVAKFLLVAPEQEVAALTLAQSITVNPSAPRLEVIAFPEIQDGTWYLLADPVVSPVIGFLTLQGGKTFSISQGKLSFGYNGIGLKFEMAHGVVPLSRVGAVKAVA